MTSTQFVIWKAILIYGAAMSGSRNHQSTPQSFKMNFAPLLAISTLMLPGTLAQGSSKATIFSDTASDLATSYDAGQQALAAVNVIVDLFKNENANGTMVRIGVNEAQSNKWDYVSSIRIK